MPNLVTKIDLEHGLTSTTKKLREEIALTKMDLREEMQLFRTELKAEIADTKTELRQEIAGCELRLRTEINSMRNEIIEHFNFVAENFQYNISAANADEFAATRDRLDNHEGRIKKLECA